MKSQTIFWMRYWLTHHPGRGIRVDYNPKSSVGSRWRFVGGSPVDYPLVSCTGGSFPEAADRFSLAIRKEIEGEG